LSYWWIIVPSDAELPAFLIRWFVASLPYILGFLASIAYTAALIRFGPLRQWVAIPRQDRWNKRTVVKFGGIPVLLAFCLAVLLRPIDRETLVLFLLTLAMGLVGLVDDILGLGPTAKLVAQITLAGLATFGGIIHRLSGHFWLDALITILWIVAITNAFNLVDNMDGLAAGMAVIALVQVILLAGPNVPVSCISLCMLAAVAGFLPFNFNPARVFMGDTGALSIGFFLACASIKAARHLSGLGSIVFVPCLVLFVPVFDMLLVSVTRRVNRRAISRGARDHTSHRLVLVGLTERQAVGLLYVIAAIAGATPFLWKSSWSDLGTGTVALFLVGAAFFWIYLAKLQLPTSWLSAEDVGISAVPEFLQRLVMRVTGVLIDGVVIILGLYFASLIKFGRLDEVAFVRFLWAAAITVPIKLTVLVLLGVYQMWGLSKRERLIPILQASAITAALLASISLVLPKTRTIELQVILIDALVTATLLCLGHASGRILDRLFARTGSSSGMAA
jgi:UDP-GlcNAc:undecaprenyl-phosphate GlcNAc-1-phosphate transferase